MLATAVALSMLVSCSSQSEPAPRLPSETAGPSPTAGAAALGTSYGTLEELAAWVQGQTGECTDAKRSEMDYLPRWFGEDVGNLYVPHVAEWGHCSIQDYDMVAMILFKPGEMAAFQQAWKQAIDSGKILDNPDVTFGNGFAFSADRIGKQLGLRYLRCKPVEELNAIKVPADVDGCVFANTPGN